MNELFGRKRPAEAVTFPPDVAPEYREAAAAAIGAGRYFIFIPEEDGRTLLLLGTAPRLIASTIRCSERGGQAGLVVEWLCEARDDHRDHLPGADFRRSCRDFAGGPDQTPTPF